MYLQFPYHIVLMLNVPMSPYPYSGLVGPIAVSRKEMEAIIYWTKNPERDTWIPPWPSDGPKAKLPQAWLNAVSRHNLEVSAEKQKFLRQATTLERFQDTSLDAALAEEDIRNEVTCKRRRLCTKGDGDFFFEDSSLATDLDVFLKEGIESLERDRKQLP